MPGTRLAVPGAGPAVRAPGLLLAGAAVAAGLALALPWRTGAGSTTIPGWYVPGMCATVHDADGWPSLDCSPGYISSAVVLPGGGAAAGMETAMRVFLLATVVLTVLAWRRASARLADAALVVAVAGLVLGGVHPLPGQAAYTAGIVMLAVALRARGLRGGRLSRRPGRYPRPPAAAGPASPTPGAAPSAAHQ